MSTVTEIPHARGNVPAAKPRILEVQPYLFFHGRCEEALGFYRRALGAEVTSLMRFKDRPEPPGPECTVPPGSDDKVMHASFRLGGTEILVSDGCDPTSGGFRSFSLSLTVPDEAEADRVFGALCEGGQVLMPLAKAFFSPRFGVVVDRFGVSWMIYVAP